MRSLDFKHSLGDKVHLNDTGRTGNITIVALDHGGENYLIELMDTDEHIVTRWYRPAQFSGVRENG